MEQWLSTATSLTIASAHMKGANMQRLLFLLLTSTLILCGCENQSEQPKVESTKPAKPAAQLVLPQPATLFAEPSQPHLFELPSEALQVWRHVKTVKPPLVLFVNDPSLYLLRDNQIPDVAELIRSGQAEDFNLRGSFFRVNPALTPSQAVSAAIENGLFSEVVWVIPARNPIEELRLDIFRKQLVDTGLLTPPEGNTLEYADGVFTGKMRGISLRVVHPTRLPDFQEPVVVHFDTSYFKGLFKNEVATPLYTILHQTASEIAGKKWQVYATTLSASTSEQAFSLDVRFLTAALARMIEDPVLLEKMPTSWKLHADSMYVGKMYMESKSQELLEKASLANQDSAPLVYALSKLRSMQKRNAEALNLLRTAIRLDPGYATAWEQLAATLLENGDLEKGLEMIREAIAATPENPILRITEVNMLADLGRIDEALAIVDQLKQLPWSKSFHSGMPDFLERLAEDIKNPKPAQTQDSGKSE